MNEKIKEKLEFLKKKKEEYLAQIVSINGAIQVLEELIKESE
jgi:prefoldin subunit 5